MKILVIGGTAFIGPYVVRQLAEQGHDVAVFHRGKTEADLPAGVRLFHGDQEHLADHSSEIAAFAPDAVIAMALFTRKAAESVTSALAGVSPRLVVPSSIDVYRAYGRLTKTEPGPPDPVPLTEESPLRERLSVAGEAYDKTGVEEIAMREARLPAAVLRLPMVYGPGDYQHRLFAYLKRMDDGRHAIILPEGAASFQGSRGYVENIATAIALAATNQKSAGHIYNVAEETAFSEQEWIEAIGRAVGWQGRVETVPSAILPAQMQADADYTQHFAVSSSKIRAKLGYSEIAPFEEGLRRTIAWERANPPPIKADDFNYAEEDEILNRSARLSGLSV